MKNSIGTSVILTIFGESHGPAVGVVLDGLAPGIEVDLDSIAARLARRRPQGQTDTARVEADEFRILSGVHGGCTTGTPIAISIPNTNVRSSDYNPAVPRPSHADLAARMKYHGWEDARGGGHFSGRVTAGIVAAGAICLDALKRRGIRISTHILSCAGVSDAPFTGAQAEMDAVEASAFPVIDTAAGEAMREEILKARSDADSVGGIVQACVSGLPGGVGEPWFDSLESLISHAMFSIGAVKGIEFGDGFALAQMRGSQANDPIRMSGGRAMPATNRNGGINGGISNALPVIFNLAVKPTPSIARTQMSVDLEKGCDVELNLRGRHDPAIVRRICPVVSAMTAVVLCDALALRYGTDWLACGAVSAEANAGQASTE